jgi:hypothetical protein
VGWSNRANGGRGPKEGEDEGRAQKRDGGSGKTLNGTRERHVANSLAPAGRPYKWQARGPPAPRPIGG